MESDPLQELKRLMGEVKLGPVHAPGLGEIHTESHFSMMYCTSENSEGEEVCDDNIAEYFAAMHNDMPELIRKAEAYDKIMALPVLHVDMVCAVDAVVIDEIPNPNELRGQRVRIVPVADGENGQ